MQYGRVMREKHLRQYLTPAALCAPIAHRSSRHAIWAARATPTASTHVGLAAAVHVTAAAVLWNHQNAR